MAVFRLGLVGAGRMGRVHLKAANRSEHVRIVAITEPFEPSRRTLPEGRYALYADLVAMLDAGGLDGILVATPSHAHVATVKTVAEHGLPMLCEKPCGVTAAQAVAASAIAADHHVHLQIGYWRRFVPELQAMRQQIQSGLMGNLYLLSCHQWDETPPPATFRADGGGIFVDMGVHEFDQLRWLTGAGIANFRVARSLNALDVPVPGDPDAVQLLCDLSNGATGLVSLGRRFPLGDACWAQAFGTKAVMEARFLWPPTGEDVFLGCLQRQLDDFAGLVRGRVSEAATGADAIAALIAAEAAMLALRESVPG